MMVGASIFHFAKGLAARGFFSWRDLAAREGLDLSRCAAYSDSINDMPLLSLVGRAVAVNPDSALRVEAKLHGWEIRDFRTGQKAARIGIPIALGVGALAGSVAAGV